MTATRTTHPALSACARYLCLAVDSGDDTALAALADELELCSDPRAEGLRRVTHRPAWIFTGGPRKWGWISEHTTPTLEARQSQPAAPVYRRLRGKSRSQIWIDGRDALRTVWAVSYPTRSAAFLALAESLVGG